MMDKTTPVTFTESMIGIRHGFRMMPTSNNFMTQKLYMMSVLDMLTIQTQPIPSTDLEVNHHFNRISTESSKIFAIKI